MTAVPDGFAEFVAARSARLLRFAWLLTGDAASAEDLLQTVLAVTWRRWDRITEGGAVEAYVRRALVTTYVSWWRRRWRGETPTAAVPERAAGTDVPADLAVRDALRRALAGLSRQQRAAVVLRYAEDLSVVQTAEILGCSPATVRVQTYRAIRALRADPQLQTVTEVEA